MAQRPTAAICNGWVTCRYKVLSSLLRLVTVDEYVFKSQPLQLAKRCAQLLFMKSSLYILNILAFGASLIWLITKPDWEPLVSTLLLLATLIGQFIGRNKNKGTKMTQKGGKKSKNYQAGGDINF